MIDLNNREQAEKKLKELQSRNLPVLNIDTFSLLDESFKELIKDLTDEEKKEINEYLKSYYHDGAENKCIFSDEVPCLTWALTHGVAIDLNTGFKWKMCHYFKINGVNKKFSIRLQYHPNSYQLI